MCDSTSIPTELQHLIEKRNGVENRQQQRRSAATDAATAEPLPAHGVKPDASESDRRSTDDRREANRRETDKS